MDNSHQYPRVNVCILNRLVLCFRKNFIRGQRLSVAKGYGVRFALPSLEVVLLTGRTRHQGVGLEAGKLTDIYFEATTQVRLDPKDFEKLQIEAGDTVEVKTEHGEVILRATIAPRPSEGIAFIPYGPWANCLIGGNTNSTGMPTMKGLRATITPAPDKEVLSLQKLLNKAKSN